MKWLKIVGIVYAAGAGLYFAQAKRQGLNPSLQTAAQWPLWLLQTPVATGNIMLSVK